METNENARTSYTSAWRDQMHPMEWSDLRIFLALAREGTLSAAARSLGLTQPTMGRRLRALEAAVGHTLFQRTAEGFEAQLCVRGAGLAVLPRPLGDAIPGLVALDIGESPPGRDTHVGYHRDLRHLSRLRALLELVIDRLAN